MIPLLLGCAWLTEGDVAALRDADGDGAPVWEDCDDANVDVGAPGARFEDADGDGSGGATVVACPDVGIAVGGDCDDADAAVGAPVDWYPDADGDGDAAASGPTNACAAPDDTFVEGPGGDCDDAVATVHSGAVEDCQNTIDDDCDTRIDECDLRTAGTVLHFGTYGGGLGAYPSLFTPTSKGNDDLVIGRPWAHAVDSYAGSVIPRSGEYLLGSPQWTVWDGPLSLGNAVAAGDVDGDGVPDMVAGAASSSQDGEPYGPEPKVVWLHGPVHPGDAGVDATLQPDDATSSFGSTLAIADLDADGFGDVAMGAAAGHGGCGVVYFAHGTSTFPEDTRVDAWYDDPTLRGYELYAACDYPGPEGGLGSAMIAVPPGVSEARAALLAIGDPNGQGGRGAVYVWAYGAGPTTTPRAIDLSNSDDVTVWFGANEGDLAGISLAQGDLDGDGQTDLATGAMYADAAIGRVHVINTIAAGAGGSLAGADVEISGEPNPSGDSPPLFGFSVAVVADVDEDGYDELAVGAPGWTSRSRGASAGAVYLFHGPLADSLEAASADVRLYGEYAREGAGWTLDAGGDLDGDGLGELAVGAQEWSADGPVAEGEVGDGAIVILWGGGW